MHLGMRDMDKEEEYPHGGEETSEKVKEITIKIADDGTFDYSVNGKPYNIESVEDVLSAIKDDLSSPHGKKAGHFEKLKNKIMSRPGFKPRIKGQSKEEAASAVTASIERKRGYM